MKGNYLVQICSRGEQDVIGRGRCDKDEVKEHFAKTLNEWSFPNYTKEDIGEEGFEELKEERKEHIESVVEECSDLKEIGEDSGVYMLIYDEVECILIED